MPDPSKNVGQQLVMLEPAKTPARERYERQLKQMLEERVSVFVRGCCLTAGAISILFGACAALVVFSDREAYGYWPNLMLGTVVAATAVAIGTALSVVAVRGVYRRAHEGRWVAASGVAMLATWGLFMLLAGCGNPEPLRNVFLTFGLASLGTAAFVAHRLSAARAQLMLEKRLLEMEYRLAEIAERLDQ
jgi:hypothetical protein